MGSEAFASIKNKKVCIYGLGSDFDYYQKDMFSFCKIVGVTDSRVIPSDPKRKALYVKPEELSKLEYEYIIITTRKWGKEIRQNIHQCDQIDDGHIIEVSDLIDDFDRLRCLQLKNDIKGHNLDTSAFVIGDSHARFFGESLRKKGMCFRCFDEQMDIRYFEPDIAPFIPFHIGPALAYNLNRYGSSVRAREKIEYLLENWIPRGNARLLFAFGEIDIRVHVIRQAESQNRPVEDVLCQIVEHYMEFLCDLKDDYELFVWGPVASQDDEGKIDIHYPRYGTMKERNKATELFNRIMSEKCREKGIRYITIFPKLIDENYCTRTQFYMDRVHLNREAWCFAKKEFAKAGIVVDI